MMDYFAIPMDAAGESNWHKAIVVQGKLVEDQQHLVELDAKLNMLTSIISTTFISQRTLTANFSSLISSPKKYVGETSQFKGFLLQCSLYSSGQEGVLDQQKITQFLSPLLI